MYRNGRLCQNLFFAEFVAELATMVREVSVCGWTGHVDDPLSRTPIEGRGVRAIGLPPFHGSLFRKMANGLQSVVTLLREVSRADFVYVFWPGRLSSVATFCCRRLRKPYGIYLRGEDEYNRPAFVTAFVAARFVLTAGQQLETVATLHCKDVEIVAPMTYLRPELITPPSASRQPGPWRLLYVGRVEEGKGVQDLVDAVVRLLGMKLAVELTIVGHCCNPEAYLRRVPTEFRSQVRMVGVVNDVNELVAFFHEADVFVFASHHEGFPRVLYEAMAFGVPIVTTFVGGIPTVMRDFDNCLRADVRNPPDLARKVSLLLTEPALRSQLAWAGHRCVLDLSQKWRRSHAIQVAERLGGCAREVTRDIAGRG